MSNNNNPATVSVVINDGKVDEEATVIAAKNAAKLASTMVEQEAQRTKILDPSANEAIDQVMKTYMNDQEGGAIRRAFENLWVEAKKTSTAPVVQGG